jgi:hypothetical protein
MIQLLPETWQSCLQAVKQSSMVSSTQNSMLPVEQPEYKTAVGVAYNLHYSISFGHALHTQQQLFSK